MPMELKDKKNTSDDEEDLESLRLAALNSLKRPSNPPSNHFIHGNKNFHNKRRSFPSRNRNGQFGQFINRVTNTNLISIPTVDDAVTVVHSNPVKVETEPPKLILPQDRYHNNKTEEDKHSETTSKFDRYDNSDKSESESEYESETGSESDSPAKLERANSLEALMLELENEITGDAKPKEEIKKNKVKKRRKKIVKSEEVKIEVTEVKVENGKPEKIVRPPSPIHRKQTPMIPRRRNFRYQDRGPRVGPMFQPPHYPPPPLYQPPMIFEQFNPMFRGPPMGPHMPPIRPFYDRPVSPLRVNTEDVLTITRAPLSPRSAAFVLQNRDAIERRKKSPRRSYSRSPSPRYRKSLSPRPKSRSRTPLKDERRLSPVRERGGPVRRKSVERRVTPEKGKGIGKPPVRERLGNKNSVKIGAKRSRSPSPIPEKKIAKIEEDLDPVLEARKRKFESNEIKNKEGIIRLKPKVSEEPQKPEEKPTEKLVEEKSPEKPEDKAEEDLLLEDPFDEILNTKVDDLFSDEETDDENEGRFKTTEKRNVSVLPFPKSTQKSPESDLRKHPRRMRSRSPLLRSRNPKDVRLRKGSRESRRAEGKRVTAPIENKKIEIKIRNPTKYETTSKYDVANEHEMERVEKPPRKVEVSKGKSDLEELDELEPEILVEPDDEDAEFNQKCDAGDLRAQLSRKRAERQNRLPVTEDVQSRLLQNALQGAVFKKQKKVKTEKETTTKEYAAVKRTATIANVTFVKVQSVRLQNPERRVRFLYSDIDKVAHGEDGKRPIHMRLGFSNGDVFQEPSGKKRKSGNKSKGRPEQVLYFPFQYQILLYSFL